MEERAHPRFFVGIYTRKGLEVLSGAETTEELRADLNDLVLDGKEAGRLIVLQPIEGISIQIGPPIVIEGLPESLSDELKRHPVTGERLYREFGNE